MANWTKFCALPSAQRRVLIEAALLLPFVWLGLYLFGLQRLRAWMQRARVNTGEPLSMDDAMMAGRLVNIAARHALWPMTCLVRSLLLDWMLQRRGAQSELRIGVRLTGGILDAHAWVEVRGIPVNDRADIAAEYAAFDELPLPRSFRSS